MAEFSKILKQLRVRNGLSQKQLAAVLNVTPSVVSQYENGTTMPGYDVMLRIAEQFHVSVDYLLGRDPVRLETENWLSEAFYGDITNRMLLTKCNSLAARQRKLLSGILLLLEQENSGIKENCDVTGHNCNN